MPFKQMKELSVFFENVKITRSDLNRLLCEFRSLMTMGTVLLQHLRKM